MTYILNARERAAIEKIGFDHNRFYIKGELVGIGAVTLSGLVDLGLLEIGPGRHGDSGWRITADGQRCMYGETIAEMSTKPDGVKSFPFVVWKWPVDLNGKRWRI